jgi:hypothetical protein
MDEAAGAWFGSWYQFGMGLFPESKEGGQAQGWWAHGFETPLQPIMYM